MFKAIFAEYMISMSISNSVPMTKIIFTFTRIVVLTIIEETISIRVIGIVMNVNIANSCRINLPYILRGGMKYRNTPAGRIITPALIMMYLIHSSIDVIKRRIT
ncbi:hypothetical protein ACFLZN_00785 [Nanoarchaeota archaeon]